MNYKPYDFINMYNSKRNPSAVHCRNTALVNYYTRYLIQKVISVYEFEGLPEIWAKNYFLYTLFCRGYLAVFDTEKFGVIFNECNLYGYNVFYQPNKAIIANPVLGSLNLEIGENCEIIQLQPDYGSIMDIVSTYADLMALCLETAGINLLNSKASFVFFADSKQAAESWKKLYDKVASGEPMAVIDKSLINDDGSPNYEIFTQNVGQNYITDRILNDMQTLEDQFNTDIGIPNANTQKRERLITDEVNANNVDTQSKVILWLETMRSGIEKVNAMFGLNLSVKYRYEAQNEPQEAEEVKDNE